MEDRLLRLEARVDELARTVERLQARLTEAGLPEISAEETASVAPAAESRPTLTSEVLEHLPSLAGRSCLVLGGAFLLRYATEGGMLSGLAGTMLALVYAFGWFFAADRAAGAGLRASAIFHVLTASFVVFPLVWESTARFDTLSGSAGAAILALAVAAGLAVGVRRSLDAAAKTVFVFALLSAAGLLAVSHQPTPFAVLLLVMGAVSLLLAGARGWTGVALSTALVVDVAVVLLIVLARSSNPPDWVLATPIAAIQMALAGVYFGAFGIFLVGSDLAAGPVTWLQAAAAFVIGFEAALPHLSGDRWPGFFALVVAAASWIFAHLLERAGRPLTSFLWAAFFGTAFAVEGGRMVLPDGWAAPFEALIVLAAVLFASGRRRPALAGLAALLAVGAAIGSALPARAIAAFYSTADQLEVGISLPLAAVALLLLAAWVRLGRGAADGFGESIARFVLLSLGLAGAGTLVVLVAASALGGAAGAPPAIPLAILRSAVLAASAIILALLRRRTGLAELRWLVGIVLVAQGGKLLVDEMRLGKAGAVVAGLALYGIALIAAPRLSKRPAAAPVPAA